MPAARSRAHLRRELLQRGRTRRLEVGSRRDREHRRPPGGPRPPVRAQHGRGLGQTRDCGREPANGVQARCVGDHAVRRDPAVGRPEAGHAAVRGRADHRRDRLRAEGQRHHPGRDRRGRPAAGAAGRVRGRARVPGRARRDHRELGGDRLARHERAGGYQPADHSGLRPGQDLGRHAGACPGRQAVHPDDVFDPRDQSVQRRLARRGRGPRLQVRRRGQQPRPAARLGHERADARIGALDPVAHGRGGASQVTVRQIAGHRPTRLRTPCCPATRSGLPRRRAESPTDPTAAAAA